MKFKDVAYSFEMVEKTSSRLEITKLVAELFKKSTAQEAKSLSYLMLGTLNPPYMTTNFAIAQKTMSKIIARFLDVSEKTIHDQVIAKGDVGSVLEAYVWNVSHDISLTQAFEYLQEIEAISGTGSIELKIEKTCSLLQKVDPLSGKYIARIILGTLRLGFSDMTLLDALSWMEVGDKTLRKDLEHAYTVCADSGHIAYELKRGGIDAIKTIRIHVGIPIRPAAAERLENAKAIIEKLGPCVVEPKLDGFRLQVHVDLTKKTPMIRFFSRNLLDMSAMFPEFVEACKKLPVKTFIADGEAIVYDPNTGTYVPFQETVKRKRKHGIDQMVSELPLQLNMFDLLYVDGESFLHTELYKRRDVLKTIYKQYMANAKSTFSKKHESQITFLSKEHETKVPTLQVIEEIAVSTAQELETYFLRELDAGLEGVVVKKTDSLYQAGKRNFNWIKLKYQAASKLNDSIDVVILGYYAGRGKRAHYGIGALLVGIYNETLGAFQTIAKVGTGFKDDQWTMIKQLCDQHASIGCPKDVQCPKELTPLVWVNPVIVCEVLADEITISPVHTAGKTKDHLGYALRFPRFYRYRDDKNVYQTTSVKEITKMYKQH